MLFPTAFHYRSELALFDNKIINNRFFAPIFAFFFQSVKYLLFYRITMDMKEEYSSHKRERLKYLYLPLSVDNIKCLPKLNMETYFK